MSIRWLVEVHKITRAMFSCSAALRSSRGATHAGISPFASGLRGVVASAGQLLLALRHGLA